MTTNMEQEMEMDRPKGGQSPQRLYYGLYLSQRFRCDLFLLFLKIADTTMAEQNEGSW